MLYFNRSVKIGDFTVNSESETFIIAEAGVNHNCDMKLAKRMIDVACDAGVQAVKFQTFKAEHLILKEVEKAPYQKSTTDAKESQYDMLKRLEVSLEQNRELFRYCQEKGIIFLTTPFDEVSLDELDDIDLPAYKIASTDVTNLPFLVKLAKKGKPLIFSTGMSYMEEVEIALQEIVKYNKDVILLQCSANYPIADEDANLLVMNSYKNKFDILIGYSDHTVGVGAAPYAIALGARVVEKHFTIDKSSEGPDQLASLSPEELRQFVVEAKRVSKFLGSGLKFPSLAETGTRASLQKCLVAARDLRAGEIFDQDSFLAKRTGGVGISPLYIDRLIGTKITRDYHKNEII